MKKTSKILAFVIAILMVFSVLAPVFAVSNPDGELTGNNVNDKGKITITNAIGGQKYDVYKIFDLESFDDRADNTPEGDATGDDRTGNYSYILLSNSAWKDFFPQRPEGLTDEAWEAQAKGSKYVDIDANGYVTAKPNFVDESEAAAAFAREALAYAKNKGITPTDSATPTLVNNTDTVAETTVTFSNLPLGYYLVDSTLGTLCELNTTDLNIQIADKNDKPTITNTVEIRDGGEKYTEYDEIGTATIGDKVDFSATINAKEGAQDYVLTCELEPGLTLDTNSIVVKHKVVSPDPAYPDDRTKDIVTWENVNSSNYTVNADDDGYTITFNQDYLDTLKDDNVIRVDYVATLNDDAEIWEDPATSDGYNTSNVQLSYAENGATTRYTAKDPAKVRTFFVDIVKTDDKDSNTPSETPEVIKTAKFKIYKTATGGEPLNIQLVSSSDGKYRVKNGSGNVADIEAGVARVEGLGNGTYYLEEVTAPEGYNKITTRQAFTIENANNPATIEKAGDSDLYPLTITINEGGVPNGGVRVINKTGKILPTTGGIGTTILYIVGGVLMVVAGVILVARKKTSSQKQ